MVVECLAMLTMTKKPPNINAIIVWGVVIYRLVFFSHCEEHSDAAIQMNFKTKE